MAVIAAGAMYVSDTANATIRLVGADGAVSTFAGSTGARGNLDGPGTLATFSSPQGLALDGSGNLYVADATNHTVRKITPQGEVSTLAGAAGMAGYADGTGTAARFNYPSGLAVDSAGNVYVADQANNVIRRITPAGVVSTIAGVGVVSGADDGTGSAALFNRPVALVLDGSGNLLVADGGNATIRKITPAGVVSTLAGLPTVDGNQDGAGSGAMFNQPKALALDGAGNLYVVEAGNDAIRKVTPDGVVTTLTLRMAQTSAISSDTASTSASTNSSASGTSQGNSPAGSTGSSNSTTPSNGMGAMGGGFVAGLGILLLARRSRDGVRVKSQLGRGAGRVRPRQ
jgi:sugar lactone lactonase YvrE